MIADEQPPAWFTDARREHAARLVVGARVRVRLNGECSCPAVPGSWNHDRGFGVHGPGDYDGCTGTIYQVWTLPEGFYVRRGHPYEVIIPRDAYDRQHGIGVHHFMAAEELEPIDDR